MRLQILLWVIAFSLMGAAAKAGVVGSYQCQWRAEDPAEAGKYQEESLPVSMTLSESASGLVGILGWDRTVDAVLVGKAEGTNLRFEAHHQLWSKPGRLTLSGKTQLVGLLDQVEREGKPWSAKLSCTALASRPKLDKSRQFTECFDAMDELKLFLRDQYMESKNIFPDKKTAYENGLHLQMKTWLEESCESWSWNGKLEGGRPSYLIKAKPRDNTACTVILSTAQSVLGQEGCPDYMEMY